MDRDGFETLFDEKHPGKREKLSDEQVQDLYEKFSEELEVFGDPQLAITSTLGEWNFEENAGRNEVTVDIVACGANGPRPFGDSPALFAFGVATPPDRKAGRIVVIITEDDVSRDLEEIGKMFKPHNQVRAEISIRESSEVSGIHEGSSAYVGEVENTDDPFEVVEEPERDADERKELVEEHVPSVEIASVGSNLSAMDGEYEADFGLDFKRVVGCHVVDAQISNKAGRYTFQDSSFMEPEDLNPNVRGEDEDIGLSGWAESYVAEFDRGSMVDVYGPISPDGDSGHIQINVLGVDPYQLVELDEDQKPSGDSGSSGGSSSPSSEAIEEQTI